MKRILLFLLTNVAIIAVASIAFSIFGFEGYMAKNGVDLDLKGLFVFSLVFGFAGSFISLFISKWMAKRSMGVQVITDPRTNQERWLMETVAHQAKIVGIDMPEVGIFPSADVNAFATGARKNSALVAVSSGLLDAMTQDEAEAVLGHEMSHIANGDMVTLTLIQGVVNTFVIFFARIIGHFVDRVLLKNENGHGIGFFISSIIAEIFLGILASTIVMWFSRRREFIADTGGADLAGKEKMIAALQRLQQVHEQPSEMPEQMAAFGIRGGLATGMKKLFMSHPPLEARIEALRKRG